MNPVFENRLRHEKSPYLLQHATNPVDWYPWGEEAFAKANAEDRPIFLSIGYSTCHWCHVMAHESFEDDETAALLNAAFVCVKVDREERPDIDGIYMRACQMMTGGGGWPLTVVMTPERRPFFTATYIPKQSRFGRTGLLELVPRIAGLWHDERPRVEQAADRVVSLLGQQSSGEGETPGAETLADGFAELRGQFDEEFGGFGSAPKFPMPHQLLFLLQHARRTGEADALGIATRSLRALRHGGIFDQLGFGLHRYSTDRQWLVPHFEKMLYDQALVALAFTEAYCTDGDPEAAEAAREVLEYVLRDLRAPEGGFFSAEDADSDGEEGRFYLWEASEIEALLGPRDARFAIELFGVEPGGNFVDPLAGGRTGQNILHLPRSDRQTGEGRPAPAEEHRQRRERVRLRLLSVREERNRPGRDDKILADWNGLMVAALARAAAALDEPRYCDAAAKAAGFVLGRMRRPDGRLHHRWCDGEAAMTGNLDDYAFLIWGLIELYDARFDARDLDVALGLLRIVLDRFRDPGGGFFFTPDDGEELLVRLKEGHDGAVPSGNAVMLLNLIRLSRITGDPRLDEEARELAGAFAAPIRQNPSAHALWLLALETQAAPSCEVVIAGEPAAADTLALIAAARRGPGFRPVLLLRPEGEPEPGIARIAPFTAGMRAIDGRAAAYVCRDFSCQRPVTDPEALARLLDEARQGRSPGA